MMNAFFLATALIVLVGCPTPLPVQKAQRVKANSLCSLNMEALCKDQATKRYNTGEQKIDVTAFEQSQGSYEMHGYIFRKEQLVYSLDADGHFPYLSMRQALLFPISYRISSIQRVYRSLPLNSYVSSTK